MIIPGNYVLGKILLGWSAAFYLLAQKRALANDRQIRGPAPLSGTVALVRSFARAHGFRQGRPCVSPSRTRNGGTVQNSSDYRPRAPFVTAR